MIQALGELHRLHIGFQAADEVLQRAIGVSTCLPSCGKCCMHNVPYCRTIEAINAVSVLTGTGKLRKAVEIAEGWLIEHHKEAKIYEGRPYPTTSPQVHQEWLDLRLTQCPFLEANLSCFIHQVRPLTCRAYGVTFEDHEGCVRPPGKDETRSQHKYILPGKLREAVNQYWQDCKRKPEWLLSSFVPTLIYRVAEPDKFKKMIEDNKIASAKIVGVDYEVSLMWQTQIEALRAGVHPDLVSAM